MTTLRHLARAVGSTGSTVPAYRVEVGAGRHHLVADEPADAGGGDVGPSPLGLLVSALVACTSTTLRMYAERHGWDLSSIEVEARYDVDEDGRRTIERTITLPPDIPTGWVDALGRIAERTPVTLAIQPGTSIATTLRPNA